MLSQFSTNQKQQGTKRGVGDLAESDRQTDRQTEGLTDV